MNGCVCKTKEAACSSQRYVDSGESPPILLNASPHRMLPTVGMQEKHAAAAAAAAAAADLCEQLA